MSSAYFKLQIVRKRRNRSNNYARPSLAEDFTVKKCRICLKDGKIFIRDSEKFEDLSNVLYRLCDIDLSKDYTMPIRLCGDCYSFLQQAIIFRNTAKLTEDSYNQSFHDTSPTSCSNVTNSVTEFPIQFYTCNKCKLDFKTNYEFNDHKCENRIQKPKNIRVQCSVCHRLITSSLYKRHLLRHQSATHLVCDVCGKVYRKDNLVRHLKSHNFELPFHCHVCPYRGRFMESLAIHMRTHSGDKPFSCSKCGLRFLTRSNLNRHLLTHRKERPFKCVECGRGFNTKTDLELHFRCDHAGIKDFGCKLCGTKYGTKKSLMRHELRVHKREKMAKGRMPLYLQVEYRTENV